MTKPTVKKALEYGTREIEAEERRHKDRTDQLDTIRFRLVVAHMEACGWKDCDFGAGVFWSHPRCKMPNSTKLSQIPYSEAVDIQNRWEMWGLAP